MTPNSSTTRRRGISKKGGKLVGTYVSTPLLNTVDDAVRSLDTDRSKFLRLAIREKLARHGFAA